MKREGFTLIEMLVVIAIIVFMIAISLPSLRNSKLQTEAVVCRSKIKGLFTGLALYENENGTFPHAFDGTQLKSLPPDSIPGNQLYDNVGWWWFHYLVDYSRRNPRKDSIIRCPSREINDMRLKNNVLCGNYGVNLSIFKCRGGRQIPVEFIGKPLSNDDIKRHSETLLIVDSGYSMISWWHVTDVPPLPLGIYIEDAAYVPGLEINKEKLWPGLERDAINGRHPNKTVNAGFADGHVEHKKADKLFVEKTETGYKNRYPLWRPIKNNND
ncbi:MAG: prepilin-type N-terminal cleavage/methylation domain-containing protein [Planctomycetota bacterium]|jgi:prepilin-type N-terminal cleavage/methylation domain-containing protein/prepilin-type processing-associated H-X9-DG protein